MNAPYANTAFGISAALTGVPRKEQVVRRVASRTWGGLFGSGSVTDIIAYVDGEYFDVSPRQFEALLNGATPEELWLDQLSDESSQAVDNSTYWEEE